MNEKVKNDQCSVEKLIRTLYQDAPYMAGILDLTGTLQFANHTACNLIGKNQSDLLGKAFWETPWWAHSVEEQKKLQKAIKKAASGETVQFQATHPTKNGKLHRIEFLLRPVKDEKGKVFCLLPEGHDITERESSNRALREREKRVMQHQAAVVRLVADNQCRVNMSPIEAIKYTLEVAADVLTVSRASVWFLKENESLLECIDLYETTEKKHSQGMILKAENYPEYFKAILNERAVDAHDAVTDPRTVEFAEGYLNPLGIVSMLDSAIRRQGKTFGVICFEQMKHKRIWNLDEVSFAGQIGDHIDRILTEDENRKAQEELRASEERFRNLSSITTEGIMIHKDNVILEANQAFADILGYPCQKDLIGKNGMEVINFTEASRKQLLEHMRKGSDEAYDIEIIRKDGEVIPAETRGKEINFNGDKARLVYLRDIRQRIKSETEKNHLQEQLQQALKMEAIGRLAGGVAHDFNNLLTVISGNIELARANLKPDDRLYHYLEQVHKAAESAASLTRQLLAFSRRQIIEPVVLNMNDLIGNLHKMLIRLIGEHIAIRTNLDKNLGSVKVDPGQFEQVLVNLAVNARDAMSDGGMLVIETANIELDEKYCERHMNLKPGSFIMLAVSDTGHGMTEDIKRRVFEPFFTTKAKGRGTGLGLATIFGVVEQSGGAIDVYSELDLGTTFKIYLPRVEIEAMELAPEKTSHDLPRGTETILLVEDEEGVRQLAKNVLTELGYTILPASNGETAIRVFETHDGTIDMLITDVVMPGMNGRALANHLIEKCPEIKVLYTSGYTENIIVHHGVIEENIDFIGKPYSLPKLAEKVREILGEG